jgi:hypothetical protein
VTSGASIDQPFLLHKLQNPNEDRFLLKNGPSRLRRRFAPGHSDEELKVHIAQHLQQILHKLAHGNFLLSALGLKPIVGQAGTARDSGISNGRMRDKSSRTIR